MNTINAAYDERLITVYQAYRSEIAEAALAASRFAPPFSRTRMTWIKPSFLWMMHRSDWATAPGQERVLAIRIRRDGFDWAVRNSCLSAYDSKAHASHDDWRRRLAATSVRVQWDPDRDVRMRVLPYRAVQIGLKGEALARYVDEWTEEITDVTALAHEIRDLVRRGHADRAEALRPKESAYPSAQ